MRDLFSLAAVTGLPLEAAETTARSRWRASVGSSLLSPHATRSGYHWEDTLAHELTHLLVTRATRDRAPLWLQEGVAKREETRWREARPFDPKDWAEDTAARALRQGPPNRYRQARPVDRDAADPEAASTAYAEVQSFIGFFVREQGDAALRLLFADLKGLPVDDADSALRSVSGYDLSAWNRRWQKSLVTSSHGLGPAAQLAPPPRGFDPRDLSRRARLSDRLLDTGFGTEAALTLAPEFLEATRCIERASPAPSWPRRPGTSVSSAWGGTEIDDLYGPWFALRGRLLEKNDPKAAARAFALGLATDPLAEEVACQGRFSIGSAPDEDRLPADSPGGPSVKPRESSLEIDRALGSPYDGRSFSAEV